MSGKLQKLFFSKEQKIQMNFHDSSFVYFPYLSRTIHRTTKALSGLRSHSPLNIRSNRQRFASRRRSTIRISTRKVKCACRSSRQRTGSQQQRQTKVSWWKFPGNFSQTKKKSLQLFKRSPPSLTIPSRNIHCALNSQKNSWKIAKSSWRMPKSSRESTARNGTTRSSIFPPPASQPAAAA